MKPYLFFRKDCFYFVNYEDDEEAKRGADMNLGTVKVEDMFENIIWEAKKETLQ